MTHLSHKQHEFALTKLTFCKVYFSNLPRIRRTNIHVCVKGQPVNYIILEYIAIGLTVTVTRPFFQSMRLLSSSVSHVRPASIHISSSEQTKYNSRQTRLTMCKVKIH